MKVGLDIHGVIDRYPDKFYRLSKNLVDNGHEVHIVTGQEWVNVRGEVERAGVLYTHHFSIVDHHLNIRTKMTQDAKDTWWMDEGIWLRSKGDYIHRAGIDIHFDDSYEYGQYIPDTCTFVLVPKTNFENINFVFGF